MPNSIGRKSFLQFLAGRSAISADVVEQIVDSTREFREAPAAIALQHHLLDPSQVECLLTQTASEGGDSIAHAERLNWLTAEIAAHLRKLQGLREVVAVCEVLLLDCLLSPASVDRELAAYFARSVAKQNTE